MSGWAIFVHDPDGDSGYGRIVGPFRSAKAADAKAETIRKKADRQGHYIECTVVPVAPGSASAQSTVDAVMEVS